MLSLAGSFIMFHVTTTGVGTNTAIRVGKIMEGVGRDTAGLNKQNVEMKFGGLFSRLHYPLQVQFLSEALA